MKTILITIASILILSACASDKITVKNCVLDGNLRGNDIYTCEKIDK